MALSNPCEQCLVLPVCGELCHQKMSYGLSLDIYVKACLNRVDGLEITDYVKYKTLQVDHRDEALVIEMRMQQRIQTSRT